jgi:hypothetical protein
MHELDFFLSLSHKHIRAFRSTGNNYFTYKNNLYYYIFKQQFKKFFPIVPVFI